MPRSIPLAHADRLLNESGEVVEKSGEASKCARYVPRSLNELVRYAVALKELRLQPACLPEGVMAPAVQLPS